MKQNQRIFVGLLIVSIAYSSLAWAETWKTKRITNTPGFSSCASIAVSGSEVYITWSDNMDTGYFEIYFTKSTDGGRTWLPMQRLTYEPYTDDLNSSDMPDIAVAGSNVYIVWQHFSSGEGFEWEIYFIKSMDGGGTWLPAERLTYTGLYSFNPSIAASGSNIYVTWGDDRAGNRDIYFQKSLDGGATWKAPKRLGKRVFITHPKIAFSGTDIYLAWEKDSAGYSNGELCFRRSRSEGVSWQKTQKLSKTAAVPSIAASGSNVYVVWNDDIEGNWEIYFRKSSDGGITWWPVQRLTNNEGDSYGPSIAVNGSNVYIVWGDGTAPEDSEIYFRKSKDEGTTWKPAKRLTNNTKRDGGPRIAASDTRIYVVWVEEVGEMYSLEFDIYLKWAKVSK